MKITEEGGGVRSRSAFDARVRIKWRHVANSRVLLPRNECSSALDGGCAISVLVPATLQANAGSSKSLYSVPDCKHRHHALLHEEREALEEKVRPATVQFRTSPRKTTVAMLHLDVLDIDGKAVRANVFVDVGSDGTIFCESFIRRL